MKWLFIPAATAMCLAVAMPAWAAPDGGTAPAAKYQMVAQNDHRGGDNKDNQGKAGNPDNKGNRQTQHAPAAQQAQKPASHQAPQNRRAVQAQPMQAQPMRAQPAQHTQRAQQPQRAQKTQRVQQTQPVQQMQRTQRSLPNDRQQKTIQTNARQQNQPQMQRQQRQTQQAKGQRYNWQDYKPGRRPPDASSHSNFDRGAWQFNRQADQRYHWNSYQRPSGWYSRRWAFGMILPSLFWSRDYWIDSYWDYGLMDPPYGYVWVRNGDDAMLVNVETGDILSVEYGLFY